MEQAENRKKVAIFTFLCCFVYFVSYLTRINFNASITEIVNVGDMTKKSAGTVMTVAFVSYALGQTICGFIGDKMSPRYMISLGLLGTSACNIILPFFESDLLVTIIWCINGLFQAMLWPPLIRIAAAALNPADYSKCIILVSVASYLGTAAVYLLVPACIKISGWKLTFFVSAAIGILTAFIWYIGIGKMNIKINDKIEKDTDEKINYPKVPVAKYLPFLIPVGISVMFQGMLRDGVTSWMPTYISDVFQVESSASILSVVVLPVFAVLSVWITSAVFKKIKKELPACSLIFGIGFVSSLILTFTFSSSMAFSIISASILTGCMHGVNLLLISYLPTRFAKYGRVSTVSGVFNTFCYAGSAISAYGIAALSDSLGWKFTIVLWACAAGLGTVLSVIAAVIGRKSDLFKK